MEYPHLKGYAYFLLDNHLNEFTRLSLQRAREIQLPMLKLFDHLSEEQLFEYSRQSMQTLLSDLSEGVALDTHLTNLQNWREGQIREVPVQSVDARDVAFTFHIRKYAFVQLLSRYTQSVDVVQTIVQEIEQFYTQCLTFSLETFVSVQQQALQEEKDLLQTVIDTTEEGMVAVDMQQRVTLWNRALEKRTGVRRADILGKGVFEIFPGNTGDEKQAFLAAMRGEEVHLQDLPIRAREGFFDMSVVPLRGQDGYIRGTLTVSRDVTERKKAAQFLQAANEELRVQQEELEAANQELHEHLTRLEETTQALSESEARLREVQAIAHLGHYRYEVKPRLLYWSEEMQHIFGLSPTFEEMAEGGYFSLIHPLDQDEARQKFGEVMRQGGEFSLEHRILRSDGTTRWLLLQGRVLNGAGGELERMDGTCLDITDRKEAELKAESERYFIQRLTDTSPDVITLYDLEQGQTLSSSREIYSLLGFSPQELEAIQKRGQSAFVDYFHPNDLANIFSFLESYKTYTGDAPRELEYRIRNAAGEWLYINDRYNVFRRNEQGLPIQVMGVARNVTDRKRAEQEIEVKNQQLQEAYEEMAAAQEELRQTNEELFRVNIELERRIDERTQELALALAESHRHNQALQKTNNDLDNFVYTASHDLKSPVTNLEGLLGLLAKRVHPRLEPKELEMFTMIQAATSRLKRTIGELTQIAKIQRDTEQERERVSFERMLKEVQADLAHLINESNAQFRVNWEVESLDYAPKNLRSILHNLISNALKYRSPDRVPEISVSTFTREGKTALRVADNGLGLSAQQKEGLFTMFKRFHNHVDGSGVGLYMIKRIVENNGGSIEVKSQLEEGTTFTVCF